MHAIVELLKHGLQVDYVVLGGGQTNKLKKLPAGARRGNNVNAILGGQRLWVEPRHKHRRPHVARSRRPVLASAAAEGETHSPTP